MTQRAGWIFIMGLVCASPAAYATPVYTFEDQAFAADTPLTITSDGLTATFSSPAGPGAFGVSSSFGLFSTLSGNVLLSPGSTFVDSAPLTVSFSAPVSRLSLKFGLGTLGVNALALTTDTGAVMTAIASVPVRELFAQGTLSYDGAAFRSITLTSSAVDFAIDDLSVTVEVPEPGAVALIGGLACLAGAARTRRRG